jgi:2-keto-4-pentenoate hydratase/2-oxohepta-3-ene-1,7-dioic acid hydratase in catechol pathway
MKLISFAAADNVVRPGALVEDKVVDLTAAGYADALAAIRAGLSVIDPAKSYPTYKRAEITLHAPINNPPRIFAIGLNYREHAIETGLAFPKVPVIFFKLQSAIIGAGAAIVIPKETQEPDYEVELAVVIGKGGFRIQAEDWRAHVYGYTIVNDVSARDVQFASSQWSMAKSFPTFCPIGPAIAISLSIDGETLQKSSTSELIFPVPQLIEYISAITPLEPGDVISTGTPSGVGMGRTPKRWLRAGETVTARIEGLGELVNPVLAEQRL